MKHLRQYVRKPQRILLLAVLSLMLPPLCGSGLSCHAQSNDSVAWSRGKVITNTRLLGVGGVNVLDTYLSPEKYSGTELRYISQTVRGSEHRKWRRLIVHQGMASFSRNRADNANEMAGS